MTISRAVSEPQRDPPPATTKRAPQGLQRRLFHLSMREYLPLLATVALWAVIVLAIGHANTARLFAATVTLRAIQMLTRLNTAKAVKLRTGAPKAVTRQARRFARLLQALLGNQVPRRLRNRERQPAVGAARARAGALAGPLWFPAMLYQAEFAVICKANRAEGGCCGRIATPH